MGTFLENLAVRKDGTLLISNMTGGNIFYLDPHHPDPQSTLIELHNFNAISPSSNAKPDAKEGKKAPAYGTTNQAEAIIESATTPDLFYTFSGQHGKPGTWAVYSLDLRHFVPPASNPQSTVTISKIAEVPEAVWLNGGTLLPRSDTILLADSLLSTLFSVNLSTSVVDIWLQDPLLGKITNRPPWPGVNGIQFFRSKVFMTSSDRGIILQADINEETGSFVEGSLQTVAEGIAGDDLAFDNMGNAYVATNPNQTVVRIAGLGLGEKVEVGVWETVMGGVGNREMAGPTAVAFGRTEKDCESLYVVTTGEIVNPVDGEFGIARVVRSDVGSIEGEEM